MSEVNDGGPAFAALATTAMGDVHHQPGMSLRDWFAGQAIASCIAHCVPQECRPNETVAEMFARKAYEAADALLQSREATHG